MNNCNKCSSCNTCGCGGCQPARYDCSWNIEASPYDPNTWVVTTGGMAHKVKIPGLNETDTTLSTDYSNSTLNYKAEKHTDTITGGQLGDIINISDLRDVNFDLGLEGNCYELIYTKKASCGAGCVSAEDAWHTFNINSDDAKQDYIRYVRGANAYGCPVYLDVPSNVNQYWFSGWKTDGEHKEFGYYQAQEVGTLPKNSDGSVVVMSVDPTTKAPVYGALPLDCILGNMMANLGTNVYGTFSIVRGTPGFSSTFNKVTGDFVIKWDDWGDTAHTNHIGHGEITGKMNWTVKFDTSAGKISYHVSSVKYNKAKWTKDRGTSSNIYLTLEGITQPGGATTKVMDRYHYTGASSWEVTLNKTINWNYDISNVGPGNTVGPLNYAKVLVDWSIEDDEGYLQVNFQNLLSGWNGSC